MSQEDRLDAVFNSARTQLTATDDSLKPARKVAWSHKGHMVCKPVWCYVNCISRKSLVEMERRIRAGHATRPPALAKMPPRTAKTQMWKVDAWFVHYYLGLAETLATKNTLAKDVDFENLGAPDQVAATEHVEINSTHPLWGIQVDAVRQGNGQVLVPKRWINPGCLEQLWVDYCTDQSVEGDRASHSTFRKAWKETWSKLMPFRDVGQGKRCRECAQLDEEARQAITEEEKAALAQRKARHITEVMADRQVGVRGNHLAAIDASRPNGHGCGQMLKILIDGMDQAKFRCPRNLAPSLYKTIIMLLLIIIFVKSCFNLFHCWLPACWARPTVNGGDVDVLNKQTSSMLMLFAYARPARTPSRMYGDHNSMLWA